MKMRNILAVLFAAMIVLAVSGCASPANKEAMVVSGEKTLNKHDRSVMVRSSVGTGTGISDPDLKAAIEESILNTKVFKSLLLGKDSDYDLAVSIVNIDKPIFGLTFTVNLEVTWVLVKQSDKSIAMKKLISSSSTATFGDAAAAVTRLRLAIEGATKKNIEQGLQSISELSL